VSNFRGGKKMAKLSEVVNQLNEENKIKEAQFEQEKLDAIKHKMGSLISKVCEWSGQDILDVLQIALEDSNYHSFNKELTLFRNTKGLETKMEYCKNI
jgi:hypothetical protein